MRNLSDLTREMFQVKMRVKLWLNVDMLIEGMSLDIKQANLKASLLIVNYF